eukprot:TRINITY_DN2151_c0_g1_i1.p1 TRINITY_DN2151_c0_g1~~TRINITY_DN2151_c0_g1_i1.p1  ORF type:complete len:236 (-),score=23.73 TRINITY_DN2151_c0_g1_i1:20-637(-)
MVSANKEMVVYCFDTLISHYTSDAVPPPAFDGGEYPFFVTWKKVIDGEPHLRGCIGTLEARCILNGFRDFALTSAFRDKRFPPIQAREVPYLECTVSLLVNYESATTYLDWEIGKHGLIVDFTDPNGTRRSATYLPEVAAEEGWTKKQTINSLMYKAGYMGLITESLRKSARVTRYQSTLYTMHYEDYVTYVKKTRGIIPAFRLR